MKPFLTLLLLLSINSYSFSQSLSPERIEKVKNCTAKIIIGDGVSTGTGFLIANDGTILTCWHVLSPVLISDANGKITGYRKIVVQFNNGTKKDYGIPISVINKGSSVLMSYDICVIVPVRKMEYETDFLKIGRFSNLKEGDEVITCGYPLAMNRPFISRGIVSTKFIDTSSFINNGTIQKKTINLALLDMTMNKGNSGGAIIKIGSDITMDEVVGLADFIITPVGKDIIELSNDLKQANSSGSSVQIAGIDPNASLSKVTNVLTNISSGISGCVSIEYLQKLIDSIK